MDLVTVGVKAATAGPTAKPQAKDGSTDTGEVFELALASQVRTESAEPVLEVAYSDAEPMDGEMSETEEAEIDLASPDENQTDLSLLTTTYPPDIPIEFSKIPQGDTSTKAPDDAASNAVPPSSILPLTADSGPMGMPETSPTFRTGSKDEAVANFAEPEADSAKHPADQSPATVTRFGLSATSFRQHAAVVELLAETATPAAAKESTKLEGNDSSNGAITLPSYATILLPRHASDGIHLYPSVAMAEPHHVMRQIGQGLASTSDSAIEIVLTPEELGRVKISIGQGDNPAITVVADRADTLDLLRRHTDLLQRELRDAGFAGSDISFSGRDSGGQNAQASVARQRSFAADAAEDSPAYHAPKSAAPGSTRQLDIRI